MNTAQPTTATMGWLPILSGILIGTSYIPFPPWASLFCFVPLWLFWFRQKELKKVVLGGWVTSFVLTLIGFNWVTYLLHEFAHLPWPAAFIGMLLYASIAHLFIPLAGALWFWGQRYFAWSERLSFTLMALLTILCETYSPTLFDWNFGYSWYGADIPIYQWAEMIGFSGLSAATLLCNLPLCIAWRKRRHKSGKRLLSMVLLGFALLNAGGLWLAANLPQPDASVNVLLVQANIGNEEKQAAELGLAFRYKILKRYQDVTDKGIKAHANASIDSFVYCMEKAKA